jgi:hypothetical protein
MTVPLGTLVKDETTDRGDTTMPDTALPPFTEAGQAGHWELTDRYGTEAALAGDFLGLGSSHRPFHKHPFPPHAAKGQHCSTCRWMEIRIFQDRDGRYLVVQTGRSVVPEESDITTLGWAPDGPAVVSALATWSESGRASFTFVARRALETASEYDSKINAAYRAALQRVVT